MILPKPKRHGDYIVTFTRVKFYVIDPRPVEVNLEDIATGLSHECRYGGQIAEHYSVAQHSVLVAMHLPPGLRRQGLMHDASEAYVKDIPRPLKGHLREYGPIEARVARAVGGRFGLELEILPVEVHTEDVRALATEKRDLFTPSRLHEETVAPWMSKITPWTHEEAKKAFLGMAHELGIR